MSKLVACVLILGSTLGCSVDDNEVYLADPALYKHEGVYYLFGTEPPPQAGFRIYASKELKDWYVPETAFDGGYVLRAGEQAFGTQGFWAPQVLNYNGKVTMLYTADQKIAVAFADHPTGPFVQNEIRSLDDDLLQIDPFLFQDDDGKLYLYHVRFDEGNHLYVAEMESDLSGIIENTLKHCLSVEQGTWENTQSYVSKEVVEGPTVLKRKGVYYLIYSANHFMSTDYAVGYATSNSPTGPWSRFPGNPILRKEFLGINGTGHGDVFLDDEDMYYIFHTHASNDEVRPRHAMLVEMNFEASNEEIDRLAVDYDTASYLHLE